MKGSKSQVSKIDDGGFDLDDVSDSNQKDEDNQYNSYSRGAHLLKEIDEE